MKGRILFIIVYRFLIIRNVDFILVMDYGDIVE